MLTRRTLGTAGAGLATSVFVSAGASAAQEAGARQGEDTAALRAFAETTHPRGREAAADEDWRSRWDLLATRAGRLESHRFVMGLNAALSWFKDGHTTVAVEQATAPGFAARFPVEVRAFHDGLYVVSANDSAGALLGSRIEALDGRPVADLMQGFARDWCASNPAGAHQDAGYLLRPAILRGADGLIPGPVDATLPVRAVKDGRAIESVLRVGAAPGSPLNAVEPTATPLLAQRPGGAANFMARFDQGRALVIAFDSLSDPVPETIAFLQGVLAAIDEPVVQRLVLDLRRNGGGNNYLGEGLRKHIERSRLNRPGGLYVLTSPRTFSAAQNLANRLERETYACFVGEPTGGAPNHCGDARRIEGAGWSAFVSSLPWFDSYPQDQRRWIMPDLFTPVLFTDWRNGKDAALEAALAHQATDADDDLSRVRTFQFGRPGQDAEWKPFWL